MTFFEYHEHIVAVLFVWCLFLAELSLLLQIQENIIYSKKPRYKDYIINLVIFSCSSRSSVATNLIKIQKVRNINWIETVKKTHEIFDEEDLAFCIFSLPFYKFWSISKNKQKNLKQLFEPNVRKIHIYKSFQTSLGLRLTHLLSPTGNVCWSEQPIEIQQCVYQPYVPVFCGFDSFYQWCHTKWRYVRMILVTESSEGSKVLCSDLKLCYDSTELTIRPGALYCRSEVEHKSTFGLSREILTRKLLNNCCTMPQNR